MPAELAQTEFFLLLSVLSAQETFLFLQCYGRCSSGSEELFFLCVSRMSNKNDFSDDGDNNDAILRPRKVE